MTIFNYTESRVFLHDYIKNLPRNGRGEISRMAQHLGASGTLISHVLSGEKILSQEQAESLCEYMGLIDIEAEYFIFLIQFERSGNEKLKKFWKNKLTKLKNQSLKIANRIKAGQELTEEQKTLFYSNPIYQAIRLFCSTDEKGKTLHQIAERFEISLTKSAEIIKFLSECQILIEQNGQYIMGAKSIVLAKGAPQLVQYQTAWRLKALQNSDTLSDQELMFTCPASISTNDFEKLREEMVQFIQKFLKTAIDSPAEEIACFTMDWFWYKK